MDKAKTWIESAMFQQWFFENWIAAGGLVTKKTAADLYNVTQARITYLIKSGKLKLHKHGTFEFLELPEIKRMVHQKVYNRLKAEYEKAAEAIPPEKRESFLNFHMEILDKQLQSIEPVSKAACNTTSITKAAEPQAKTSTKKPAKRAGRPRTPEGKRGRVRKAV